MAARVVILGGGFGGIYTALELEKFIGRGAALEVVLVNRDNFFLFTPMLHEVAASDLDATSIVNPIHKLLRRVQFFCGNVDRIDLERRTVTVSHGANHHSHDLTYDHLVLALGSTTNFFGSPGVGEHARTMKTLEDAMALRAHIIAALEEADFECCKDIRRRLLTFVVAGGGFAGVETIASINDFIRESLGYYRNVREEDLRIVLVSSGEVVLPELSERLGRYAQQQLLDRGVEVFSGTKVKSVEENCVLLTNGERIESATLVWTAGTSANPLIKSLSCTKERDRVVVNAFLELPDRPGVWALGDCAAVPDLASGKVCPPTAQHACRQGVVLARNIVASISGGKKAEFRFSTLGQLAAIGRRTGVANILGWNFSGFLAWWMWRTIYLMKLPRFEKKFRVALDWSLDLFFSKDLVQFINVRTPVMSERVEREESRRLENEIPHALALTATHQEIRVL